MNTGLAATNILKVSLLEWARRAGVPEESGGAYAIRSLDSGRGKDVCGDLNKPYLCLESPHMSRCTDLVGKKHEG